MDETYGKFANLGVVDTQNLLLLGRTQAETRYQIEQEQNDAGSAKGVSEARDRAGQLVGELDPVLIQPTTLDDCEAVEMGNVITIRQKSG